MIDNLIIAVHISPMNMLILLSVDKILLPRYVNLSFNFRLCSSDLAWAGVFTRNAKSSAYPVSVGYRLLLVFYNVKPFSFY